MLGSDLGQKVCSLTFSSEGAVFPRPRLGSSSSSEPTAGTGTSRGRAKPLPSGAFPCIEGQPGTPVLAGMWDRKDTCGCWGPFPSCRPPIRAPFPWTRGRGARLWRRWESSVGTEALWAVLSSSATRTHTGHTHHPVSHRTRPPRTVTQNMLATQSPTGHTCHTESHTTCLLRTVTQDSLLLHNHPGHTCHKHLHGTQPPHAPL